MSYNLPITDWHGKTVWLVGASSGIGLATAEALHAEGAKVIVSARNQAALDQFVAGHTGAMAVAMASSSKVASSLRLPPPRMTTSASRS